MRVALVGPIGSGKSTLFAAVLEAGGSHVDLSRRDQVHLGVVKVPDERVEWLRELYQRKKAVYAELEFIDIPGFDLSDPARRRHAQVHWGAMRQSDMIVLVVRGFADPSVPAYCNRVDPAADVEELLSEMLFADLDQVTNRIEKLQGSLKKPTSHHDEEMRELELMQKLSKTLEAEKPIAEAIESDSQGKLVRSFAFLSQKPMLVVLNCSEEDLGKEVQEPGGLRCIQLSAKIEEEIAQLPPEERGEFLTDLGLTRTAAERLIRSCYQKMDLISFLTVGSEETRAWTVPIGTDAVTAAEQIHSDIARGFIRAETVSFEDLRAAGDMKAAKAAGKVRLEGKTYIVRDGDVINFRFNV